MIWHSRSQNVTEEEVVSFQETWGVRRRPLNRFTSKFLKSVFLFSLAIASVISKAFEVLFWEMSHLGDSGINLWHKQQVCQNFVLRQKLESAVTFQPTAAKQSLIVEDTSSIYILFKEWVGVDKEQNLLKDYWQQNQAWWSHNAHTNGNSFVCCNIFQKKHWDQVRSKKQKPVLFLHDFLFDSKVFKHRHKRQKGTASWTDIKRKTRI